MKFKYIYVDIVILPNLMKGKHKCICLYVFFNLCLNSKYCMTIIIYILEFFNSMFVFKQDFFVCPYDFSF